MNSFEFITYKGKKKLPVQVPLPDLQGASLIETHAHLDMLEDPALALARAGFAGLTTVLTIADISVRAETTYGMLEVWREGAQMLLDASPDAQQATVPDTYIIAGIHPHNSRHFDAAAEKHLRRLAEDSRTVALGEAGLDYYYDHSPRDVQRAVFRRKLELAHELDLPVIVHLRDAHDDGLHILTELGVPARGAVLHCYNRDLKIAEPFLDLGCVLGFGGPVTFKSAHEVKAAAQAAPADRILIETDCPFMAPTPFRGQKCEPAHCLWVAQEIADLRNMPLFELAQQTSNTAASIFRLPQI
ncbi:MAG: TatD family hydrolase [Coriobacteriia bacterium]|nr:TatD family hydrolase [Coriobacteriia bacterium]MCL2606160.1 TatD family hydrolase [Coriobacteriia bacterium]